MALALVGPLAVSVFLIAVIVLVSWIFALPQLTTLLNDKQPMAPTTAAAFLVYSSYWCYWYFLARGRSLKLLRLVLGLLFMTGSLLILLPYFFGGPDLENLLHGERLPSVEIPYPGRMSPLTACMFFNLGLSLVCLLHRIRGFFVAQFLVLLNIIMSLVFLVGYLMAAPVLYSPGPYTSISNLTVFCFLLVSFTSLCAYPRQTVASLFASSSLGGFVARRLLPLCFLGAVFGGSVCVMGERSGLWSKTLGISLQAVIEAAISGSLVAAIALSINKIERDREQAIKHKEKLLGQRDNFMAVLTHDLKNPLIGNEQVLSALMRGQLGQLTEGQSQLIGVVKQANHELLTMIKNLLALYRYDRDNPSFDLSEIDVAQVLQEAIANVQELASLYKAEISTNLSAELPLVTADFTALAQVLTNLLQNAIKSGSAEGSRISLEAKVESAHEQAEHRHVVVLLKDQGLGLTERELELLFYGYRQTAGGVEQSSGTALGLYLSYQIVRAMGGNLSCESKLGAGSTFRIELPLSPKSVAEVL